MLYFFDKNETKSIQTLTFPFKKPHRRYKYFFFEGDNPISFQSLDFASEFSQFTKANYKSGNRKHNVKRCHPASEFVGARSNCRYFIRLASRFARDTMTHTNTNAPILTQRPMRMRKFDKHQYSFPPSHLPPISYARQRECIQLRIATRKDKRHQSLACAERKFQSQSAPKRSPPFNPIDRCEQYPIMRPRTS